jgi:hypothetical protein
MSKAKECARNSNIPFEASLGCVKSLREKAYRYDEGWKLVKNSLWNLKLNWLNFSVLLLDYAEGINIL